MTIAVDFDGTIVENDYPRIGEERPFATDTLKMLIKERHRIILWTVRQGALLDEAIDWCRQKGVEFWAVNKDYPEENGVESNENFSRKIKADIFVDDTQIGGLPDWGEIYQMVRSEEPFIRYEERQHNAYVGQGVNRDRKHHSWWQFWKR